jgi:hypothetical protein
MAFDVTQYELEDSALLTFKNKRGDGDLIGADGVNPVQARMYSPGSPQGVKALHKAGRASQMRTWRMMREQFDANDAVNAEREHAEKLAGFTAEFINWPLSPIETYSNPKLCYMANQAAEFIGKTGNF